MENTDANETKISTTKSESKNSDDWYEYFTDLAKTPEYQNIMDYYQSNRYDNKCPYKIVLKGETKTVQKKLYLEWKKMDLNPKLYYKVNFDLFYTYDSDKLLFIKKQNY